MEEHCACQTPANGQKDESACQFVCCPCIHLSTVSVHFSVM